MQRRNLGGGGGVAGNASKVRKITKFKTLHQLGTYLEWPQCILHPKGRGKNGGVQCPWGFSCLSRSSSQRLELVGDQEMRDEKGFHTIRDS